MNSFIPSFHHELPASKMTAAWCAKAKSYYYNNSNNSNLLSDKNIPEIKQYATGDIKMDEFKRIFKSNLKKEQEAERMGVVLKNIDNLQYNPLPLICTSLNSAISLLHKRDIEVSVTAQDPLAEMKKIEDVAFLKNRPKIKANLKELTDQMNVDEIDLGATEHSAIPFSDSPYGLDMTDPEDLEIFANLLYKLGVETCFETLLQSFYAIKNVSQVRLLEETDQFYYGVSSHRVFENQTTGLPDAEYAFPGDLVVPHSDLPDYSDRTHEYLERSIAPLQLLDYMDEDTLEEFVNGKDGYCKCNGIGGKANKVNYSTDPSFKVIVVEMAVRTVDWVGKVSNRKSKKNFSYAVSHDEFNSLPDNDPNIIKTRNYAQNTYTFYWLKNTEYYFGIEKLGYGTRTKGQEAYQSFPHNIYRSQKKSAVENSIGENKKAISANIKLNYEILNAAPSGMYIDIKYLRNTIDNLTEAGDKVLDDLIALAMERRIMLGDSSGFDGKADGQQKPFVPIPGGLNQADVAGYISIIYTATQNIADFTGINKELTGQSKDPNSLIGLEKLRQQSGLNALYYADEAITKQYQKMFNQWSYIFQSCIKKGGKPKEAIEAIIGSKKVDIIRRLDQIPLHNIGATISVGIREEERYKFERKLEQLKQIGAVKSYDEYILMNIPNIKDRWGLLAIREKNFEKKQDEIRKENMANMQQLKSQEGENQQAVEAAANKGKVDVVYAKADAESKLIPLRSQAKNQEQQTEGMVKKGLQIDRHMQQTQKERDKIQAKANAEQQAPFNN